MTTFLEFGEAFVKERARYIRGARKEWNRWSVHVATACFAGMQLEEIRGRHIGQWHTEMLAKRAADRRGDRPLAKCTIERCHALVSVIFVEALRRELVTFNPCAGQKLRMPASAADAEEKWAFLTLDEMNAIKNCAAIPAWDRWGMQFAWGSGLRQGEQCNLELRDVHTEGDDPHVIVRWGSPGLPPKSGKTRRVPLLPDALEAARELVKIAATVPNPHGLLFPAATGARRSVGKPLGRARKINGRWVDPFHVYRRAAGITRPKIKWHSLRHTCASALVMGTWNRFWSIEEIKEFLGHADQKVTQRYAHMGEDAMKLAARETAAAAAAAAAAKVDVAAVMARGPDQVRAYGWRSGLFARVVRRFVSAAKELVAADERVA